MSKQQINLSPDLKKLEDDGYEIAILAGHLILYNVPYVNAKMQVKRGVLASTLDLSGERTITPRTHVVKFAGEYPCDKNGRTLEKIRHESNPETIYDNLSTDHSFSSKPEEGYKNYYDKMTTYVAIISRHAQDIDPDITARTYTVTSSCDPDEIFNYVDTASSRAGINAASRKLELGKVGIIGLGGTGSYILDLVAKTPVREIHLIDGDDFLQHNAFRSPGAPSLEELREKPKKVHYLATRYSKMHKKIIPHDESLDDSNLHLLDGMDFVFVCIDEGKAKLPILKKLETNSIPFVDVGMGVELVDDALCGIVRVTTGTTDNYKHIQNNKRISFSGDDANGVYNHNIQIADLNALNAALAVIRWKKHFGFYLDLENEHHSTYTLDGNVIYNEDKS